MMAQPANEVKLIPVEEGVADRGVLSESFHIEPLDLRQDVSFEQLYRVEGSEGVFVRKAGGLQAVFRNPDYLDVDSGAIPLVPAGTIYSIGKVSTDLLGQLATMSEPMVDKELSHTATTATTLDLSPISGGGYSGGSLRFIDDESYRRERLTLFVLEIVLAE